MLKLTSESTHQIAGYGLVKVIKNPGQEDPLWREVNNLSQGDDVEVDGERYTFRGLQLMVPLRHVGRADAMSYCQVWGLAVRPVPGVGAK